MEFLDIYDESKNLTGRQIQREAPRGSREYVLAAVVWVTNSCGELLITLRSAEKASWPGYWENTGGAVLAGERSCDGCLRELREETGIYAHPDELVFLTCEKDGGAFFDIYATKQDIPLESIRLQAGETEAAMWVTVEKFEKMCENAEVADPIIRHYRSAKPLLMEFIQAHKKQEGEEDESKLSTGA